MTPQIGESHVHVCQARLLTVTNFLSHRLRSVHSAVPKVAWEHENLDIRSALGNQRVQAGSIRQLELWLCLLCMVLSKALNFAATVSRVHKQSTVARH